MSSRQLPLMILVVASASCLLWMSQCIRWIVPANNDVDWSWSSQALVSFSADDVRSLQGLSNHQRNETSSSTSSSLGANRSSVFSERDDQTSRGGALLLQTHSNANATPLPLPLPPPFPRLQKKHGHLSATSRIASHLLVRDANGNWKPHWRALRKLPSIDEEMFPTSYYTVGGDDPLPNGSGGAGPKNDTGTAGRVSHHQFLGFIRITKTGSTSLLRFLNSARRLQTLDRYMRHAAFKDQLGKEGIMAMKTTYLTPPCAFGHHLLIGQTAPSKSYTGDQCQHLTYYQFVSNFVRSLDYYRFGENETAADRPIVRVSLDLTTIVREPVERYLSYFHYWRKIYPAWNATAQPKEREALVAGDFEEFLRQVAALSRRGVNSFQQYEYLASPSADYAIDLIRDRRVLPLLNDCFNASLLLLADLYPEFVSYNETLRFVESGTSVTNARSQSEVNASFWRNRGLEPEKEFDLDRVKSRARAWLANEYRFYEASVHAFVQILLASRVNRDEVRNCVRRLGSALQNAPPSSSWTSS